MQLMSRREERESTQGIRNGDAQEAGQRLVGPFILEYRGLT